MSAPALTVRHAIEPRFLQRGWAYFAGGHVMKIAHGAANPLDFLAYVEGAGGPSDPYVVELTLRAHRRGLTLADHTCSCPVGDHCKHVAAVLYALEASEAVPSDAAASGTSLAPPASGPMTADDWFGAMQQSAPQPAPLPQLDDTEPFASNFAYSLSRPDGAPEGAPLPTVQLRLGSMDKRQKRHGEIRLRRVGSNYAWEELYRSGPDAAIMGLLNAAFPPPHHFDPSSGRVHGEERTLHDAIMAPLIWALVDSGRCLWEEGRMPLQRGGERPAAIAWRADAQGNLRLTLALEPGVVVLGSSMPLYVDPAAAQVGVLKTLAPEPVLRALQHAPALTPAQAETVYAQAPQTLKDVLPFPKAPPRRHIDVRLQPKLTLRWASAGAATTVPGVPTVEGILSFVYGDHEVLPDAPQEEICVTEADGSISCFNRQRAAEKAAVQQGIAQGLEPQANDTWRLGPAQSRQAFYAILDTLVRPLEAAGWQVVPLPELDQRIVHADAPLQIEASDSETGGGWFQAQLAVDIEGERYDLVPLIGAAMEGGAWGIDEKNLDALPDPVYLPAPGGRVIAMAKERFVGVLDVVKQILTNNGQLGLADAFSLNELLDTGDASLGGNSQALQIASRLQHFEAMTPVKPPRALRAELRPYQQIGITWLQFLRSYSLGGILADDMGLGKTVQVIAHILRCKQSRALRSPFLVVAPTGLLSNWQAELTRFAPTLTHTLYHGVGRDVSAIPEVNVAFTSYGTLTRDEHILSQVNFDTVVLDESQLIKNPRSASHHAARALQADHHICLSGTPLQNNLEELWAQFAFCMPGLLGNHKAFASNFSKPIKTNESATAQRFLNQRTKPFMLRRSKKEVATELPDKTETIERVVLGRQQADLYEAVRSVMDKKIVAQIQQHGMAQSTIAILAALLRLRQVCCDARLLKLDKLPRSMGSAKLERLLELLPILVSEGRKVLVFSQFTSMLSLIAAALDQQGLTYLSLTGQTKDRGRVTGAFQAGEAPILLVSLKAGGVGLNLTAADTVIHYDPWWNPSAEQQATDRAYRIGQKNPVHVYKLIVAGSLEEKILQMQAEKQQLVDQVLNDGTMAKQLNEQDVQQIFAPLPNQEP